MSAPTRIVCLGGGYVAIFLTKALRTAIRQGKVEVTIVSRENYHTFHGFVAEMLTGRIQPGQIISPARRIFQPSRFFNAEIESINLEKQTVTVSRSLDGREYELPYDHLVLALGSIDDLSRYRGVAEHAFKLKTYADCFRVRNHIINMLELAEIEDDPIERRRLLTFVIAGGNYAGIEVATELVDYFHLLAKKEYPRIRPEEVRVVVTHSGESILPELRTHFPNLVRYANRFMKKLAPLGLEVRLKTRLVAATEEEAVLSSGDHIQTRTIISCTGTAQSPLLDTLPYTRDERGRVLTDTYVRVQGTTNVWAAGDCAAVPHPKGGTCPALGIYALYCGRQAAQNIVRIVEGKPLRPFNYPGLGDACSLGQRHAVAQVKGVPLYGVPAWIVWRLFLLYFIPTWDRRVRLVLDWVVWPFIGRDIVNPQVSTRQGVYSMVFEPGQIVVREGDVGHRLYVIRSGEVEVVRDSPEGEIILNVLGVGQHFGEMAVFNNVRRTATVRARGQVELLAISREEANSLSEVIAPFGETLRQRPG